MLEGGISSSRVYILGQRSRLGVRALFSPFCDMGAPSDKLDRGPCVGPVPSLPPGSHLRNEQKKYSKASEKLHEPPRERKVLFLFLVLSPFQQAQQVTFSLALYETILFFRCVGFVFFFYP